MATTYSDADAIADIPNALYDVLRARFVVLAGVTDAVGAERKALWDEIDRREKEVAIKLRIGALSAADLVLYQSVINSPTFSRN